jgi:hypothetical protein
MALLPLSSSRGIKSLLTRLLGGETRLHLDGAGWTGWHLAEDRQSGFGTDDGANGATRAALGDQVCGVVPFGGEMFHINGENVLGTGMDAQLASLAIDLADFYPTSYRHELSSKILISTFII